MKFFIATIATTALLLSSALASPAASTSSINKSGTVKVGQLKDGAQACKDGEVNMYGMRYAQYGQSALGKGDASSLKCSNNCIKLTNHVGDDVKTTVLKIIGECTECTNDELQISSVSLKDITFGKLSPTINNIKYEIVDCKVAGYKGK
ncbi:hypothetical protein LPJ66_003612 [Kickxella alabastrina]|uniref:Uncharacterized protein n=1 Tax=Kickxella alabastrina TaxID=61397 RepID=A0ACC1ILW0_9FUNG|nr:hypothetical protein LPJ66_003612 [Kickxella alabastrina]